MWTSASDVRTTRWSQRRDLFAPDIDIDDARQRWLFRMIHSRRPLQEKMAMFWHNHFATAYSKLAADSGERQAAKMLAHKPGALRGPQGQIELFRQYALGNFRDLLIQVAQDPAMVIWLDGKSNTKARPQENFGREIIELFTIGVGNYVESDVYAAARVFTGWNLRGSDDYRKDEYGDLNAYQEFVYNADQHDTGDKTFSFPIYSNGSRTIASRSESAGMQDGIELITALAIHPETGRRLARKFWNFFISEIHAPDPAFVESVAAVYLQGRTEIRPVIRHILNVALVHQPGDAVRTLLMACGIRRSIDQRSGLAELLGRQGAIADGGDGTATLRTTERRWMAAWRRVVLDGNDARPDEFRRDARRQPESRSSPRRWPHWRSRRRNCSTHCSCASRRRHSIQRPGRRSCRTSPPRDRGPAAMNNSTPGPRVLLASSSALPSTNSFRRHHGSFSTTLHPQRRRDCLASGLPRLRSSPRSPKHKASAHATSSSSTLAAATTRSTR